MDSTLIVPDELTVIVPAEKLTFYKLLVVLAVWVRLPPELIVNVPERTCWTLLFWVKVPALFIVIDPPEVMLLVRVKEVV